MLWLCVICFLLLSPASLADVGYLSDLRTERYESRMDNGYSGLGSAHHIPSPRTDAVPASVPVCHPNAGLRGHTDAEVEEAYRLHKANLRELTDEEIAEAYRLRKAGRHDEANAIVDRIYGSVKPPMIYCQQEIMKEALIPAGATPTRTGLLCYVLGALSVSIGATASVLAYGWRAVTMVLFQMLRWPVGGAMIFSSPFWIILNGPDLPQWASYAVTTIPGWALLIPMTAIATWLVWAWEWDFDFYGSVPLWPAAPVFGGVVLFAALLGDAAVVPLALIGFAVVIGAFLINPPLIFPMVLIVGFINTTIDLLAWLTTVVAVPVSAATLLAIIRVVCAVVVPFLGVLLIKPDFLR